MIAVCSEKKFYLAFLFILMLFWTNSAAWAGGSFAFADLRPILNQQPQLASWLTGTLEFASQGDAIRIGQNVNPHFGGKRVGPYVILARPKGAPGPYNLEVTVETELICKDAAGNTVEVSKAKTIQEKFSSITIRPYQQNK